MPILITPRASLQVENDEEFPLSQETMNRIMIDLTYTDTWPDAIGGRSQDLGSTVEISEYYVNEFNRELSVPATYTYTSPAVLPQSPPLGPFPGETPQPTSSALCPITKAFEGEYGFYVDCPKQQKTTKGASYTYDDSRRKLFVNLDRACPFHLHVKRRPPIGTTLRVTAVFSDPNDTMKVVKRCIRHIDPTDPTNQPGPHALSHVIRCDSPYAVYMEDPSTGRHSVVMDYVSPEAGMTYRTIHLRFMCLNSCTGGDGMNRRPIKAVFTLEHGGQVLGRLSMDVRVCACPTRDRRNEEKARLKLEGGIDNDDDASLPATEAGPADTSALVQTLPQKRGLTTVTNLVTGPPTKTTRTSNDLDGDNKSPYQLTCSSQPIYSMLQIIRDALAVYANSRQNSGNQGSTEVPGNVRGEGRAVLDFWQDTTVGSRGVVPSSPVFPGCQGNGNMCSSADNPCRLDSTTAQLATIKVEPGSSREGPAHPAMKSWLEALGLQRFYQTLVERGCSDITSFLQLSLKDILEMEMTQSERTRLLNAVAVLHPRASNLEEEDVFASQESLRATQLSGSSSGSSTKSYRVTRIKIMPRFKDDPS